VLHLLVRVLKLRKKFANGMNLLEPKPQPIPEASKIEKKPEEPKPEPIRHEPKAESRKKAKEVPEDILRKVLEIE
jgi:hypothetical protein